MILLIWITDDKKKNGIELNFWFGRFRLFEVLNDLKWSVQSDQKIEQKFAQYLEMWTKTEAKILKLKLKVQNTFTQLLFMLK